MSRASRKQQRHKGEPETLGLLCSLVAPNPGFNKQSSLGTRWLAGHKRPVETMRFCDPTSCQFNKGNRVRYISGRMPTGPARRVSSAAGKNDQPCTGPLREKEGRLGDASYDSQVGRTPDKSSLSGAQSLPVRVKVAPGVAY